jgi:hypothetical protein
LIGEENENLRNSKEGEEESTNFKDLYNMFKMRCDILTEEKQNLERSSGEANREMESQFPVIEGLQI